MPIKTPPIGVRLKLGTLRYVYNTGLSRHKKTCDKKIINDDILNEIKKEVKKEIEKEYKNKLKITKNNKNLQLTNNGNGNIIINNQNIVNQNIVNISTINNLNLNFGNVIDIETFIKNYKNHKYSLTKKQCNTILENYKTSGLTSYISSLDYYLKDSAIRQYKDTLGINIPIGDIILPFVLDDKYLREHLEKFIDGNWKKTMDKSHLKILIIDTVECQI